MTSALIVFVDLGGVIIDKDQQITQWQGLVGECFVRLLGGTQEAWTLAHRLVTTRLEKWEKAYGQTPTDFLSFYRSYQLHWVTGMCELLGILIPAEEECLGLAYRAIASITRCIQAGCPLCQRRSARIHSRYVRQVADLPGWAARFAWNYPRIAQRDSNLWQSSLKMCLFEGKEPIYSHQGGRYDQYRRWRGDYPDLFGVRPLDAFLVWRSHAARQISWQA